MLIYHILNLRVLVVHLNRMHLWSPFRYRVLPEVVLLVVGIDVLFHSVAVVLVVHDRHWLDLHDWWPILFAVRDGPSLLGFSFNTVRHLIMIYITELVVLWGNICLNSCSISAVESIHLVQSRVELHFISQNRPIWWERIKWYKIGHAGWVWIDHLSIVGWLFLWKLLIKMHVKARHHLRLQIIL